MVYLCLQICVLEWPWLTTIGRTDSLVLSIWIDAASTHLFNCDRTLYICPTSCTYVLCMNISCIENLCLRNSSCVYEACVALSSDKKC